MSTIIDPAKLKVVELRAELSTRGLDTKGNKPVLVKRLREALEAECGEELPDTSIADTTTEELNSSQEVPQRSPSPEVELRAKEPSPEPAPPEKAASPAKPEPKTEKPTESQDPQESLQQEVVSSQKIEHEPEKMEVVTDYSNVDKLATSSHEKQIEEPAKESEPKETEAVSEDLPTVEEAPVPASEPVPSSELVPSPDLAPVPAPIPAPVVSTEEPEAELEPEPEPEPEPEIDTDEPMKECEDDVEMTEKRSDDENADVEKESSEPRNRKSRWGSVIESEAKDSSEETSAQTEDDQQRGEKRKLESPVPDRAPRRRSRSPIKEDEPEIDFESVQLSWSDSDLNLIINKETFLSAEPMHNDGFGYMWAGVRSTHGVRNGKVWYEVKLTEVCNWKEQPSPAEGEENPEPHHLLRVGWSLLDTNLQLGEYPNSYGYDSDGLKVSDSTFSDYGKKYAVGDVVGVFLDLESDPVTMDFTVNGEIQGVAFNLIKSELPENSVMFPHVLSKNIKFEVNFGTLEEPWFKAPEEFSEYCIYKEAETKVTGYVRPEKRQDCEILMMYGLPCCGKTFWANKHVQDNPEKKYYILGNSHLLDKMKYKGLSRKELFKGNWNSITEKCTRCVNKLIEIASSRRRNFIIDQTNLFTSAQKRKLRPFEGYQRRAVVVIVSDDEQTTREKLRQQADGKDVPDSAVLEMKASMSLPKVGDHIDEVIYAEMNEKECEELVQKYHKQGRDAGYGPNYNKRQETPDKRRHWGGRNNKNDRDNRNNRWSGGSGGGGGGGGHNRHNNWSNQRSGGGNWNRHDNRNHHHGGGGGGGAGNWRNNGNNRGGYNRNQGGAIGAGGYNRNRNQPPHRNQMNKGGNWGQGGGNWNAQGGWGGQGGWGHQGGQGGSSGWNQGNWNQYGGQNQGGNNQWKGYNTQQYQQGYGQGYQDHQYGNQQYSNWNYYGQYAQGWNTQSRNTTSGSGDNSSNQQQQQQQQQTQYSDPYNQQQQQQQQQQLMESWAQYTQGGYGYGNSVQTAGSSSTPVTGNSAASSAAVVPANTAPTTTK